MPCLVDASGIQPTYIGDLPPQLTALIRTNINVQELTVAALMTENREHIYHAAMMDPHTAAELDLDQIWTWSTTCSRPTATGCPPGPAAAEAARRRSSLRRAGVLARRLAGVAFVRQRGAGGRGADFPGHDIAAPALEHRAAQCARPRRGARSSLYVARRLGRPTGMTLPSADPRAADDA